MLHIINYSDRLQIKNRASANNEYEIIAPFGMLRFIYKTLSSIKNKTNNMFNWFKKKGKKEAPEKQVVSQPKVDPGISALEKQQNTKDKSKDSRIFPFERLSKIL